MTTKELEIRKNALRENYIRCMALNELDGEGSAKVEIDGLFFSYKVGRNNWLYLTELPEELSVDKSEYIYIPKLEKITIPLEFDILFNCFNFYASNVDLGNILYIISKKSYLNSDDWQGLYFSRNIKGEKLRLSQILDENFKPAQGIVEYLMRIVYRGSERYIPQVRTDVSSDLLYIKNYYELELSNLKFVNKRLQAYTYCKDSPYMKIENNLMPGEIGYEELIANVDEQIKMEREYIMNNKAYRIYKYGYGHEYWVEDYKAYMMGIEFMNWNVKYDKKRDLVVVDEDSADGRYPAWADAVTDDLWSFRSGKKVKLLTDDMKIK